MTLILLGTFSQQHNSYDQSSLSDNVETFYFKALHAEDLEKALDFLSITCLSFEKPRNCR
jgi:hypothetical protein